MIIFLTHTLSTISYTFCIRVKIHICITVLNMLNVKFYANYLAPTRFGRKLKFNWKWVHYEFYSVLLDNCCFGKFLLFEFFFLFYVITSNCDWVCNFARNFFYILIYLLLVFFSRLVRVNNKNSFFNISAYTLQIFKM